MKCFTLTLLIIASTLFFSTAQANEPMFDDSMMKKFPLSLETQLNNNFSSEINNFWNQHAQIKTFESEHGGTIHTVHIKTGQTKAVVFSQGRNESTLKYKEFVFDLYNQGYDIFLIDHRGQGFSSRLGGDEHRGHVQKFTHYTSDLMVFIDSLQLDKHYQFRYLLGHSMGGAINALYLEENQHPFQAAAFFSPMFSINIAPLPNFIAKTISYTAHLVCSLLSDLACYAPGVGAYSKSNFEGNKLTSSYKRYTSAFNTFETEPQTQLGGPTMHWINESLYAGEKAIKNASLITIPFIILQAGADSIVNEAEQQTFIEKNQHCTKNKLVHVAGAKHEILLEKDKYRVPALTAAFNFFQQYQQGNLKCTK